MKRRLKLSIALLLVMTLLVGCSKSASSKRQDGGTLVVNVNPSISVDYSKDGSVNAVKALNKDGEKILENYTGYEGKNTNIVVTELIEAIAKAGYLVDDVEKENRQITIELEKGSKLPNDAFLSDILTHLKTYLESEGYLNNINFSDIDEDDLEDLFDFDDIDDLDDNDDDKDDEKKSLKPVKPQNKDSNQKHHHSDDDNDDDDNDDDNDDDDNDDDHDDDDNDDDDNDDDDNDDDDNDDDDNDDDDNDEDDNDDDDNDDDDN